MAHYLKLMTQVEDIIKTERVHPEEQCHHIKALLTLYLTDRVLHDVEEKTTIPPPEEEERMPDEGRACVKRFLEMVRERGLGYTEQGPYYRGKSGVIRVIHHCYPIQGGYITLINCETQKDTPGLLRTNTTETFGWTRPYGRSKEKKSYDMIGKPVSEIYDIIDKIIECTNRM